MTVSAKFLLASLASVSNRVMARKLERERKKQGGSGRGRGEEEVFQNRGVCGQACPDIPSLSPVIPFFLCCRPNFSRRTRAETLATQAKVRCKYPG